MANWTGYISLGNYAAGVFTEMTAGAYARRPWTLSPPLNGRSVSLVGADFGTVSGGDWSWNAVALYPNVTGGSPALVYPLATPATAPAGTRARVQPMDVAINTVDFLAVGGGASLVPAQVAVVTGLPSGGAAVPTNILTFGPS